MKKSIKNLGTKTVNNIQAIKGGEETSSGGQAKLTVVKVVKDLL